MGGAHAGAVRAGLALLRAARLPHARRGASGLAPVPGHGEGGNRYVVRAAAPAGPRDPGRAAPDQRAARQPRRAVRDGGRHACELGRRGCASAAEGDRLDGDDPARRSASCASVRPQAEGVPASRARRARLVLRASARPAGGRGHAARAPLRGHLRAGPALQAGADPRLRGAAARSLGGARAGSLGRTPTPT